MTTDGDQNQSESDSLLDTIDARILTIDSQSKFLFYLLLGDINKAKVAADDYQNSFESNSIYLPNPVTSDGISLLPHPDQIPNATYKKEHNIPLDIEGNIGRYWPALHATSSHLISTEGVGIMLNPEDFNYKADMMMSFFAALRKGTNKSWRDEDKDEETYSAHNRGLDHSVMLMLNSWYKLSKDCNDELFTTKFRNGEPDVNGISPKHAIQNKSELLGELLFDKYTDLASKVPDFLKTYKDASHFVKHYPH